MNTQTISLIITITITYSGFLVGLIRWLQSKNEESLSLRLTAIEKNIEKIQAELVLMPKGYVLKSDCYRQEDQIATQLMLINRKLDDLAKEVKNNARN